ESTCWGRSQSRLRIRRRQGVPDWHAFGDKDAEGQNRRGDAPLADGVDDPDLDVGEVGGVEGAGEGNGEGGHGCGGLEVRAVPAEQPEGDDREIHEEAEEGDGNAGDLRVPALPDGFAVADAAEEELVVVVDRGQIGGDAGPGKCQDERDRGQTWGAY